MTKDKLYVDFHIIQTVPPSCVNRDDTGSPKTAIYGGVHRARVSSQAWKKATRDLFKEILEKDKLAQRTKDMVGMVIEHIPNPEGIENLSEKVRNLINIASLKASKPLIPSTKLADMLKTLKDYEEEQKKALNDDTISELLNAIVLTTKSIAPNFTGAENIAKTATAIGKFTKAGKEDSDEIKKEKSNNAEKLEEAFRVNSTITKFLGTSSSALYFLGYYEAKELANLLIRQESGEKIDQKEVLWAMNAKINGEHLQSLAVETAFYGRLVTNQPMLNTDASCQVAHAISTHKVDTEFDYFTAIDDRSPEDSAGAGMIGTVEFNSSTLYRYATIAAHDLKKQLGGSSEAAQAVAKFAEAFITSMPTGKQNTFANRTVPDYVMIAIRKDQPVNLVSAFEEPVKTFNGGFVKQSIEKLTNYSGIVYKSFCDYPLEQYIIPGDKNLSETIELLKKKVGEEL